MNDSVRVNVRNGDSYELYVEEDGTAAACVFDGAYGWHNVYRVVDLAVDCGMQLSNAQRASLEAFRLSGEDGAEIDLIELSRRAEDYLNEQVVCPEHPNDEQHAQCHAAEDHLGDRPCMCSSFFGWSGGDFFLANQEWWSTAS